MQLFDFAPEIIDIIIAVIIYFSAFSLILKNLIQRVNKNQKNKEKEKAAFAKEGGKKDE